MDAGYRIHLRKINAANYGIPQHRKRVIAIGALGFDPLFPEPTHMAFGAPGSTKIKRNCKNIREKLPNCPTIFEALEGLPKPNVEPPGNPNGHFVRPISEIDLERMRHLKPGQTMKDIPKELL